MSGKLYTLITFVTVFWFFCLYTGFRYENIKTESDGHSGASFSVCLRSAIETLNNLVVVYAEEVSE